MLDGNDVRAYNDEEVVRLDTSKGGAEKALNMLLRKEDYRPYSLLYEKMIDRCLIWSSLGQSE